MGKLTLLVRNSLLALLGFVLIARGVGYIVSEFVDNQRAVSDVANEIQDVKKGVVEDAANFKYMNYGLLALFVPLFGLLFFTLILCFRSTTEAKVQGRELDT